MPNHVTNKLVFEGKSCRIKEMIELYSTHHPSVPRMTETFGGMTGDELEILEPKAKTSENRWDCCWRNPTTGEVTHRSRDSRETVVFEGYEEEDWTPAMTEERTEFPDCNKVIPKPESLNCTAGCNGELGYAMLTGKVLNQFGDYDEYKERFEALSKERQEECLEEGRIYKYNVEHHGYANWYDWSIKHWGTKWGTYNCRIYEGDYYFDSAWSPPTPVLVKMSEEFPDIKIIHSCFDEGWCFWGIQWIEAGEVTDVHSGGGSELDDVGRKLCLELKGYDPDDEDEDEEIEVENTNEKED